MSLRKNQEIYLGSALAPGEQDSTQASNYLGNWDASTNTPTLVNGTGVAGQFYICTVAGTCDFGAGAITFTENDWVVYTGTAWVINTAEGSLINDDTIDTQLTWSSHKINGQINGLLDDNFTSTDTTWSSSKIQQAINTGTPEDVYIYKGEIEELPESAVLGNVYKCNNVLYWWNGTAFEPFENIRSISVNSTAQTITNGNVDITVPTQTSDLINDSGFIDKTVNDLDNYYTESETDTLLSAKQPKTLDAPITVAGTIETTVEETLTALNSVKANTSDLATVATTGDYTDLSNTPTLGTASAKDFTDNVRPNSHDLVEAGAVYNAIINSVSSIYTPRGSLSCAELTSTLLIEANVGNVYEMSDSGTTSALFLQGAGETINVGDNVGIIKAGESTILFNLMANAFDLTDYQKQDLSSAITIGGVSQTTVEGALGGLNSLIPSNASTSNKLATIGDISGTDYLEELSGAIDLNNYLENKVYIARNGTITSVSNAPDINSSYLNAGFGLQVYSYGANNESSSAFVTQIFTAYHTGDLYYRSRSFGGSVFIWSSWEKVTTNSTVNDLQLTYDGSNYPTTSDLITKLTSDIVARKHSSGTVGGNIAITWTGKSCIVGSYSIHDSGAGLVILDFENDQDGNNHCVYIISNGSATGITWSKLATKSNFYNLSSYGGYATGTKIWWKIPNLFVVGSDFTYRTNVFLLSARDSGCSALLTIGDNGSNTRTARITMLNGTLDGVTDFYFDSSTCSLYYAIQWSRLQIVQLSGQKIDIADAIQTSSSEATQYTTITPVRTVNTNSVETKSIFNSSNGNFYFTHSYPAGSMLAVDLSSLYTSMPAGSRYEAYVSSGSNFNGSVLPGSRDGIVTMVKITGYYGDYIEFHNNNGDIYYNHIDAGTWNGWYKVSLTAV